MRASNSRWNIFWAWKQLTEKLMWSGSSCMMKDMTDPVCPYAKIVELYNVHTYKKQSYRKSYFPNSSITTIKHRYITWMLLYSVAKILKTISTHVRCISTDLMYVPFNGFILRDCPFNDVIKLLLSYGKYILKLFVCLGILTDKS